MRAPFDLGLRSRLEGAAWLNDSLLLLTGRLGHEEEGPVAVVEGSEDAVELDTRAASYRVAGDGVRTALVVTLPEALPTRSGLQIRTDRRRVRLSDGELDEATSDLESLLAHLGRADPRSRRRVQSLIADAAAPELTRTASYTLARKLDRVRRALCPAPRAIADAEADRQGLQLEQILAIDERSLWVRGWAGDRLEDARPVLVSPEGHRVDPLEGAHRHPRPDVDRFFAGGEAAPAGFGTGTKHGFARFLELEVPSLVPSAWVAEVEDSGGEIEQVETPVVTTDEAAVRNGILVDINDFARLEPGDELLRDHALPALTRMQERLSDLAQLDSVTQYGIAPRSPEISVIVPLYGRIDLIEHQLSQFVHDEDFRDVDLIYVLDSPELAPELERLAAALHALYELPFRTAILNRNAGYAIASNLGASLAHGRLLVLLHSDVLPDVRGWARTMAAFYDATPTMGALGPKLLYEDGSLQHAGMYFERQPGTSLWHNLHYFKGLQADLPAASAARAVPGVTGACLMIARSVWEEMRGLRPVYVQGGFEDSDLCLRLIESGRDNWYLPAVSLRHLEDQAHPSMARELASPYNTWLQTHMWGERIEQVMQDARFA